MQCFFGCIFLVVFIVYARKGQFEDDESPAVRILFDDEIKEKEESGNKEDDDEKEKIKKLKKKVNS
jgi:cbb3-type cytochrome oxidase maturation protein